MDNNDKSLRSVQLYAKMLAMENRRIARQEAFKVLGYFVSVAIILGLVMLFALSH